MSKRVVLPCISHLAKLGVKTSALKFLQDNSPQQTGLVSYTQMAFFEGQPASVNVTIETTGGSGQELSQRVALYLISAIILITVLPVYRLLKIYSHEVPTNAPPVAKGNLPFSGAWGFWGARWDWCKSVRDWSPTGNYSFHVGRHHVVGLSGDEGRQVFFDSKELGLVEGYASQSVSLCMHSTD